MQRSLALSLALLCWGSSCVATSTHEARTPNTLSSAERAQGWQLLFDGHTTAGWRGYRQQASPAGWQVVDGALTRVSEAGDLVTLGEFQSFELEFEWCVAPGANSGLIYLATEDHDAPWETGPEYQILDNAAHRDGLDLRTSAASDYAMYAPSRDMALPAGEWNQARIFVCGPVVEHWLNGEKVVQYVLGSADWKKRVSECKWKDHPDYGTRTSGHIVLQDHGDWVAFRSLRIRPIVPAP